MIKISSKCTDALRWKSIYICILILFSSLVNLSVYAQVTPNFEAKKTTGCPPCIIEFNNLTENFDNYTYVWDFGNGNTSTSKNPTTTYNQHGTYSVTLTVIDGEKSNSLTLDDYIIIYAPPSVDFTPNSPQAECTPMSINFTNVITPDDITYTYLWDFGDGNQDTQANPNHAYTFAGTYNVTLIVEDENGCAGKATKENLITAQKPTAFFKAPVIRTCSGELNTTFSNLSYGNSELSYEWDFGDSTTSNEENPSHTYSSQGQYNVSLKVIDNLGCWDSTTFVDYIDIESTVANFHIPVDTICPNSSLIFTNNSINNRKNHWNFGDNTSSEATSPSHKFSEPGDYMIELSIENYECTDSYQKKIHVEDINVDFNTSVDFNCEVPFNVDYSVTGNDMVTYDWRFGNGKTSDQKSPSNTFEFDKTISANYYAEYTDTLLVTSKYGCKSKIVKPKSVTVSLPRVSILSDASTTGCTPLSVALRSSIDYNTTTDNITSYKWFLNDILVSTDQNYNNTFEDIGINQVKLKIETALGCSAERSTPVAIGKIQSPNFSVKDKNVFCASEYVEYVDETNANGETLSKKWDFGDGETDPIGLSIHQYVDTGYMDVTLTVSHNGCFSAITKEDFVYINGPIASLNRAINCNSSMTADIDLKLLDADAYTFDFGDGTIVSDAGSTISHTYSNKGEYDVTLTASKNSCSFVAQNTLSIVESKAFFDTTSIAPCIGKQITFDPQLSEDADFFVYEDKRNKFLWDFGDGTPLEFTDSPVDHVYKAKGDFVASLVIKDDNNCVDTIRKEISIFQPSVNFTSDYVNGCLPVTFKFTDNSLSENSVDSWSWDFGDGNESNLQSPEHSYSSFGNYDVELTLLDSKGCLASKKLNQEIKVIEPDASFKVSDATACVKDSIEFLDSSDSNIESFLWNFGDGNTSNLRIPKHVYQSKGKYDVSLKIIDDHGCEETNSKTAFIHIQEPPTAMFSSPVTESNCYPFSVEFINETSYEAGGTQKWLFGDNLTGSDLAKPKHIYTKPDEYDITLIAFSSNGCPDTLTKEEFVQIRGPYAEIDLADTACIYNNIEFALSNKKNVSNVIWDFGDGYTNTDETSYHKYNRDGTIYPLIVLNSEGSFNCDKAITDSIYIDQITSDYDFLNNVSEGCIPLHLGVTNESDYAHSYDWVIDKNFVSTEENPTLTFVEDGNYEVELIANSDFGCYDTISKTITAFPLPNVIIANDTFVCRGNSAEIWAQGGVKYEWDNGGVLDNNKIDFPIASPLETTNFSVTVTDLNNCSNDGNVKVTVQQPPKLELQDSTIIIGESIQLDLSRIDLQNFNWVPSSYLSCTQCPNPVLKPMEDTKFIVSVSDTSDCFIEEFATNVSVQKKFSVSVPEAFTPNGDEVNDIISVNGWGIHELIYFRVFNRLGQLIFESNNINDGWNGSFKGKPQNPDIYNYVVKVKTYKDQYLEKKGNIKLIR